MAWAKISDWLKEYGGPIASALVIFGALIACVRYVVNSEVSDIRSDVTSIKSSVSDLKTASSKTNDRIDDLLKDALERAFPVPSATAKNAKLEDDFRLANSFLQLAKSEQIRLNPQIIGKYGGSVAAIAAQRSALDAVWPAASQLINYRSQNMVPDAAKLAESNLPNCTDHDPPPSRIVSVPSPTQFTFEVPTYENCRFTLDSDVDSAKVNGLLQKQGGIPLRFNHCLVIYRGGIIHLNTVVHSDGFVLIPGPTPRPPIVYKGSVTQEHPIAFTECLFEFQLTSAPPKLGKEITRALLASSTNELYLSQATHS